jgi:fucose permease
VLASTRSSRLIEYTGYYSFVVLGWQLVVFPSLIRSIETDFHQSDAAFGLLYLVKALLYLGGAFAGGYLTERLGRRVVLSSAGALTAFSIFVAAIAPSWWTFVVGAALVSLGGAAVDGGINGLFLDLFRDSRGGALNFLHLFFGVGALLAPLPIGFALSAGVSWRLLLLGTAAGTALVVVPLAVLPMPQGRFSAADSDAPSQTQDGVGWLVPFFALAAAIGFYVAAEVGVSSWVVRLLSSQPVTIATAALSIFWLGLSGGRLASRWFAEMWDYTAFTVVSMLLASISLVAAVLLPWLSLSLFCYGLTGFFFGPVYPMIMAIGGELYPARLAALSGGLTAGAAAGGIVYPPLMGFMASRVGLRTGMLGAAAIGIPCAACLLFARSFARSHDSEATAGEPSAALGATDETIRNLDRP